MPTSNAEAFRAYLDVVATRDFERIYTFYDEDVVITLPFAKPTPAHLRGREAIREHFRNAGDRPISLKLTRAELHETPLEGDRSTVVAEFDYDITNTETGAAISVSNVIIARMSGGVILESHDYHDHTALATVLTA